MSDNKLGNKLDAFYTLRESGINILPIIEGLIRDDENRLDYLKRSYPGQDCSKIQDRIYKLNLIRNHFLECPEYAYDMFRVMSEKIHECKIQGFDPDLLLCVIPLRGTENLPTYGNAKKAFIDFAHYDMNPYLYTTAGEILTRNTMFMSEVIE